MAQTIPILLSNDLAQTIAEYRSLSFVVDESHAPHGYLIATLDDIEIHFSIAQGLDPKTNQSMCYIRTDEVDAIHMLWKLARISGDTIPRLEPISDKPWGMREFAFVDSSGNLLELANRSMKIEDKHYGDAVLIVGAGLAGLFLALRLAPRKCIMLSQSPIGTTASSAWAQGGIAAALGDKDSAELHTKDTIAAGAGLVDETAAKIIATDGGHKEYAIYSH